MSTNLSTIVLSEGESLESVYWAVANNFGYIDPYLTREAAEDHARSHPSRTETLSYADRDRGVKPAGSGTVELRGVIRRKGSSTDMPLLRYDVTSERQEAVSA